MVTRPFCLLLFLPTIVFAQPSLSIQKEILNKIDLNANNELLDSIRKLPDSIKFHMIKKQMDYVFHKSKWIIHGTVENEKASVIAAPGNGYVAEGQGWKSIIIRVDSVCYGTNMSKEINVVGGECCRFFNKTTPRSIIYCPCGFEKQSKFIFFIVLDKELSKWCKINVYSALVAAPSRF